MGSEQSSSAKREAVSQNDVHRALEAQRKLYEERCRQLLSAQRNAQPPVTMTVNAEARPASRQSTLPRDTNTASQNDYGVSTARPTEAGVRTQKVAGAQASSNLQKSVKPNINAQAPTAFQPTNLPRSSMECRDDRKTSNALHPRPGPNKDIQNRASPNIINTFANQNCLERNRSPYNMCREELQNTVTDSNRTSLYPDLNQNQPSSSRVSTPTNNNVRNSLNNRPNDFVFVNRSGETEKFKASAPPLDNTNRRPRDRSVGEAEVNCKTCNNIYTLYIFNCPEGHSSCKSCKERGAACGLCRRPITDMRNITLEAFVAERKVPCFNKNDGCNLFVKLSDMESHVKECPFKEMVCPLNSLTGYCHWRGKLNHLSGHFDNVHTAQRQAEENKEMYLPNICSDNKYVYLIVKGNFNFLFHVWVSESDRMIYMTTQLIGTKFSSQKWTYEIHIYNKREPRRKYEYTDSCNAAVEAVGELIKESRCASIPLPYAMNFVNEGIVCFKFFINKVYPGRGNFKNQRGRGGRRQN